MRINQIKLLKLAQIYLGTHSMDDIESAAKKVRDDINANDLYFTKEEEVYDEDGKHYACRIFEGSSKIAMFRGYDSKDTIFLIAALKTDPDFHISFIPWETESDR